jgi:hypothetical protein
MNAEKATKGAERSVFLHPHIHALKSDAVSVEGKKFKTGVEVG